MRGHKPSNSDIGDLEICDKGHGSAEGQTCQNISEIHKTSEFGEFWEIKVCGCIEFMLEDVSKQQASVIFHLIHDSRKRFVMSFLSAELVYAKCFYDSLSIIYIFSGDI